MTLLTAIFIYPIKSLRGIPLQSATVAGGRLSGDREWLLVDGRGRVMHQGDYPQMARLSTARTSFGIFIESDSASVYSLPATLEQREQGEIEYVRVWRRSVPVTHVSYDADAWFSSALSVPGVRLMAFVRDRMALEARPYETSSSLNDVAPFQVTTEESLADLNRRMKSPIPMNRPTLVVRGAEPYSEDDWKRMASLRE